MLSQHTTTYKTASCHGELIRLLRQCRGCKQQMVAKKLGLSQQALSKIENASLVPPEKVAAILAVLNCTEADLENIRRLMAAGKE
jgi:transcriptional regulator with XRE-family HTH domain